MKKAILVAYYFPPVNTIAAIRAIKLSQCLMDKYGELEVIANSTKYVKSTSLDKTLLRKLPKLKDSYITRKLGLLPKFGFEVKQAPLDRLLGRIFTQIFCSIRIDWSISVILKLLKETKRADMIYITGAPFFTFAIVLLCSSRKKAQIVIEYRDLWTQNPRTSFTSLMRKFTVINFEKPILRRADKIVTVSDGCKASLLKIDPRLEIDVVRNLPSKMEINDWIIFNDAHNPLKNYSDFFNICIVGSVYKECSLDKIVTSLSISVRSKICIHYVGSTFENLFLDRTNANLVNLVNHGLVARETAMSFMKNADLLLSLISNKSSTSAGPEIIGLMTTKIFDYLLSKTPILNIAPLNCDATYFLSKYGGKSVLSLEADDSELINNELWNFISNRQFTCASDSKLNLPTFEEDFESAFLDI
ncbi:hypothetical protein OAO83_03800 [Amylibacter sp.]|nr:hypothetical protein [Amylibacter sp.]